MLSEREKKEMLEDGRSKKRRDDFRFARQKKENISLDAYLSFLDSMQKIFGPFKVSDKPTITKYNKL